MTRVLFSQQSKVAGILERFTHTVLVIVLADLKDSTRSVLVGIQRMLETACVEAQQEMQSSNVNVDWTDVTAKRGMEEARHPPSHRMIRT